MPARCRTSLPVQHDLTAGLASRASGSRSPPTPRRSRSSKTSVRHFILRPGPVRLMSYPTSRFFLYNYTIMPGPVEEHDFEESAEHLAQAKPPVANIQYHHVQVRLCRHSFYTRQLCTVFFFSNCDVSLIIGGVTKAGNIFRGAPGERFVYQRIGRFPRVKRTSSPHPMCRQPLLCIAYTQLHG